MDFSNAPNDVLIEIFQRLPAKDAAKCSMVCKNWKKIIGSYNFWINHCKFYNYLTDAQSIQQLHKIPISALKILIAKRAFNRNLLDDDYSGDVPIKDKRWSDFGKVRRGYYNVDIMEAESPVNFLDNENRPFDLDECEVPFASCLASSFQTCYRFIYVDLAEYGLSSEVLELLKPTIIVTEFYTNRRDCSCKYNFSSVMLNQDDVDRERVPNIMPNRKINEVRIQQWQDEYWRKMEHVWNEFEKNETVMCLSVEASDNQFWAGNYGVKIAGTSIQVKLDFNNPAFN